MASKQRRVLDVNILAIFLVEDHPGNPYVSPVLEEGLRGAYIPLVMDILPIRAYWVMTKKWGCSKQGSADAIKHFIEAYDRPEYFCLHKQTIGRSLELAWELRHDVYDCVYIAAAMQENASAIITTDTDFEKLCRQTNLECINPVPEKMLMQYKGWKS